MNVEHDPRVSYGARVTDPHNLTAKSLSAVAEAIRSDAHLLALCGEVARISCEGAAKEQIQRFKRERLPYFLPAGEFSSRAKDQWSSSSDCVSVDVDDLTPDRAQALRSSLALLPSCVLAFISPSGRGAKALIRVPPWRELSNSEYFKQWGAISAWLSVEHGIEVDPAAKDCSRACYLSHDPDCFLNLEAVPWGEDSEQWLGVYRASEYLRKLPESIEGSNGSGALMAAIRRLDGLPDTVRDLALRWYNGNRCTPPWSAEELARAVQNVAQQATVRPVDWAGQGEEGTTQERGKAPPDLGPWEADPIPLRALAQPPRFDAEAQIPEGLQWVRDYIGACSRSLSMEPDWSALLILSAVSMAACGAAEIELFPGYKEPPAFFAILLALPSERKSQIFKEIMAALWKLDAERREKMAPISEAHKRELAGLMARLDRLTQGKGREAKLSPEEARQEAQGIEREIAELGPPPDVVPLMTSEATPEALERHALANYGCFGIFDDEGAAIANFLGKHSNGQAVVEMVNKAYSGGRQISSRVGRGVSDIGQVLAAVALTVQPAILADVMRAKGAVDRGFLARFAVASPRFVVADQWAPPPIPGMLRDQWEAALGNIWAMLHPGRAVPMWDNEAVIEGGEPVVFSLSGGAAELAQEFHQSHAPGPHDPTNGWAGKARGLCYRIALLLHLLEDPQRQQISGRTMQAALSWYDYLMAHYRSACAEAVISPEAKAAERLLASLDRRPPEEREGVLSESARDLLERIRGESVPDRATFDRVADVLREAGYMRPLGRSGGHGRPSEYWELHPSLGDGQGAGEGRLRA